ncbi:MAG: hypothetical protein U5K37_01125 [Natrialbaceae archaeon]|nr:hypothetical protein [Natrialbaceae archaeon]
MTASDDLDAKFEQNLAERRTKILEWAAYVRTHPASDWGEQVNTIVDAQLQSARHFEDVRPQVDE